MMHLNEDGFEQWMDEVWANLSESAQRQTPITWCQQCEHWLIWADERELFDFARQMRQKVQHPDRSGYRGEIYCPSCVKQILLQYESVAAYEDSRAERVVNALLFHYLMEGEDINLDRRFSSDEVEGDPEEDSGAE